MAAIGCGVIACSKMAPAGVGKQDGGVAGHDAAFHSAASAAGRSRVERDAGPRDDDDVREREDLAPAVPRGQAAERVGAEQQHSGRCGSSRRSSSSVSTV